MAETAYVDTPALQSFAQVADASTSTMFDQLALSASRAFDRAAGVSANFFAVAGATATAIAVRTDGSFSLRLPPFVPGSLTTIVADTGFTFPSAWRLAGDIGRQYLIVDPPPLPSGYAGEYTSFLNYEVGVNSNVLSDYFWSNFQNYPTTNFSSQPFNLTITARWGWDAIPSDVVQAVIEYALVTWRTRTDPMFGNVSGTRGTTDNSMIGFHETAAWYAAQYSQKALFG